MSFVNRKLRSHNKSYNVDFQKNIHTVPSPQSLGQWDFQGEGGWKKQVFKEKYGDKRWCKPK